ncbi:MAG: excisionase family DNA-binding protein [Acidimicrobiia bacterium]
MHHNLIGMLPDDVARQLAEDLRPRDAYSIEAAARRLSVSTRFAEQLIERGELRAFRVGRRTLVSRRALDDFIELHEASAR